MSSTPVTITRLPPGPIRPELTAEHFYQRIPKTKGSSPLYGIEEFRLGSNSGFEIVRRERTQHAVPAFAMNDRMLQQVIRSHAEKLARHNGSRDAEGLDIGKLESQAQEWIRHCCKGRAGITVSGRQSPYLAICSAVAWFSWRHVPAMRSPDVASEVGITANNVRQIRHRLCKTASELGYPTIPEALSARKQVGGFASGVERERRRTALAVA